MRSFAEERNWTQFHSPKNLGLALVVEAGELLEPFQWLSEEQSRAPPRRSRPGCAPSSMCSVPAADVSTGSPNPCLLM